LLKAEGPSKGFGKRANKAKSRGGEGVDGGEDGIREIKRQANDDVVIKY
jgi:hypothetical protein